TNGASIAVSNGAYTLADSLTNLEGAANGVVSGATSYSLTDTALTAANLAGVTIAGLAAAQADAIAAVHADSIVAGATNGASIAVSNGAYTLADSLVNIADPANSDIVMGHTYALTDETTAPLANLSVNEVGFIAGATNAAAYTDYSLSDTAANLVPGGFAANVINASTNVTVTDAASVAQIAAIQMAATGGTVTYTLADSLANVAANPAIVTDHTYTLTDGAVDLGATPLDVATAQADLAAAQLVIDNSSNASKPTLAATYTLADSLTNLAAPANADVVDGAATYALTDATLTAADLVDVTVAGLAAAQAVAVDAVHADSIVAGATNGASITVNNGAYTLADSLINLAADPTVVSAAESYRLTDATLTAATVADATIAGLAAAQADAIAAVRADSIVAGATNGLTIPVNNGTYSLTDSLANIENVINATLVNGATSYAVTVTDATDSGGLTANVTALSLKLTDVNASASTQANHVTLDATTTSFEGGSGNDTVTIATAPTHDITGGAGTDELVWNAAGNFNASTSIMGFETLGAGTLANGTLDATGFSTVHIGGATAGDITFSNAAAGTGLVINGASGHNVTYSLATDTASDAVNVTIGNAPGSNTLTLNSIENVTINSMGNGAGSNQVALVDASAKTLTVAGIENLVLTNSGPSALTSVNASTTTNGVNLSGLATANAVTEIGGTGADVLHASAGLSTLTGNGGADTFGFTANVNGYTYATVTDFNLSQDTLDLSGLVNGGDLNAAITNIANVTLDSGNFAANLSAAAAGNGSGNALVSSFIYGGNTYVVVDNSASATFQNGTHGDQVIKLSGLVDLTLANVDTSGQLHMSA
ncbi:hypothetical protein, partial [Pseudomonas sp.]|uniref:beta strand repeat-containing protein n=1 Tax=Pseudomonas sp. TaxID=306 RepID=UPI002589D58C